MLARSHNVTVLFGGGLMSLRCRRFERHLILLTAAGMRPARAHRDNIRVFATAALAKLLPLLLVADLYERFHHAFQTIWPASVLASRYIIWRAVVILRVFIFDGRAHIIYFIEREQAGLSSTRTSHCHLHIDELHTVFSLGSGCLDLVSEADGLHVFLVGVFGGFGDLNEVGTIDIEQAAVLDGEA